MDLSGYRFETLHQDSQFALCRGRATENSTLCAPSVLMLKPMSEHQGSDHIRIFEQELALRGELDSTWAVRPRALSQYQGRAVLVLEDVDGEPLHCLLRTPTNNHTLDEHYAGKMAMELGLFLRLAVGVATSLGELHRRGIIHKNLKPEHILVNVATARTWIRGFGTASRLPRERQSPGPPESIAGTLAYMAPEQTGRMNRSIDVRSDLYALGVTFYEMLTGSLPFNAEDPMEWVHCHIARQAIPPDERAQNIPAPVSAIILKLLAKAAEDRYQTSIGLRHDLVRCLAQFEAGEPIRPFGLAERDIPDRLLIAQKLYGRERDVEVLLAAFNRIVEGGAPELVLVSGYSGVGKSSVVNELHKILVPPRGLFAAGKFDQYKRDIPYSTLAQAFQSLVRPLLAKSDSELWYWRKALIDALRPNGQLMVDLIPELKFVIGEQGPVPELSPQDAQRRFKLVFRRFLAVFARPNHPLALFLDDLQWLDTATLELLEDLLGCPDFRHLLLIGAYRDNEVTSTHPLMRTLDRIRSAGTSVHQIALSPLDCEQVGELIADSLCCAPQRAAPLVGLVHEKTGGNPFFVAQFLTTLVAEGLLSFDHDLACWTWDLYRIQSKGYTDNVVDLMVSQLNRLSTGILEFLQELACLGNSVDSTWLTIIHEGSEEELRQKLEESLQTELILHSGGTYHFVHDRVREAAYSLIPEARRAEAHRRFGTLLAKQVSAEKREEAIFEIVNQLNRGAAIIERHEEMEQLAEFNLIAGKRAKASTAYASALRYLTIGAELLPEGWGHRRNLKFALELHRAECELLTGDQAAAERRLTMLASRAASVVDQSAVTCLRSDLYTSLRRGDRSIGICLDYLRSLGIDWLPHPTDEEVRGEYERIWPLLGSRDIEELIDLPLMSAPESVATMDVLARLISAARFSDSNLFALVVCRMVNLSIEYGNTDASCYAYADIGSVAGPFLGDYKTGFRFGQLGHDLVEQRGLRRFQARTDMIYGVLIWSWAKHMRTGPSFFRQVINSANRTGDLLYAAFSYGLLIPHRLAAGDPLADVQREAEAGLQFTRQASVGLVTNVISAEAAFIRTMRGLTGTFGNLTDATFDEGQFERHLSLNSNLALPGCCYWIRKLQARFFAADYSAAIDASLHARQLLWALQGFLEVADFHFYSALTHSTLCDSNFPEERDQHIQALTAYHTQLMVWAEICPENFENRTALIGAEIARVNARVSDAERLYEAAIKSARDNGFIHNEGLASEIAARFYAARGFERISNAYLRSARSCYLRWGAEGKVRQLDQLHRTALGQ